jgi:hypothetical protein
MYFPDMSLPCCSCFAYKLEKIDRAPNPLQKRKKKRKRVIGHTEIIIPSSMLWYELYESTWNNVDS